MQRSALFSGYKELRLSPRLQAREGDFVIFFSTASGWGTLRLGTGEVEINLREGELAVERLIVSEPGGEVQTLAPHLTARAGEPAVVRW